MRLFARQSLTCSPRSTTWSPSILRCDRLEDRTVPDATMFDLTTRGSNFVINGAIFQQSDMQPTGTGHIDSFLRIQGAAAHGEVQEGYNTDARPLQFDENKSPNFTR